MFAPIGTRWYPFLSKIKYPGSTKSNDVRSTILRVGVDQLGFSPFGVSLYFTVMGLMQQKSTDEIKKNWHENFLPTLLANWALWPAFQAVNFTLVPVRYRLLAVNIVSIGWNAFLSHKYAKSNEKVEVI